MTDINAILAERGSRYGDFKDVAETSQRLKACLNTARFVSDQAEALDMICNKLARIVNGDPNYAESWRDIAGYAQLVAARLMETDGATDAQVTQVTRVDGEWKS